MMIHMKIKEESARNQTQSNMDVLKDHMAEQHFKLLIEHLDK